MLGWDIRIKKIFNPAVQGRAQNNGDLAQGVGLNEKAVKSQQLNLNPSSKAWRQIQTALQCKISAVLFFFLSKLCYGK